MFLFEGLDSLLNFPGTPLCLHLLNDSLNLILSTAPKSTTTFVLIVLSYLSTQMTAAGMDNQKQAAILSSIHLNKMVASTKRADAAHSPVEVHLLGAAKLGQVDLSV